MFGNWSQGVCYNITRVIRYYGLLYRRLEIRVIDFRQSWSNQVVDTAPVDVSAHTLLWCQLRANDPSHWMLPSIYMQERPPPKRVLLLIGCSSSFTRLAEHPPTFHAWCKQYLPGRGKPYVLRPGIVGMGGSMAIPLQPCMIWGTPPPPNPTSLRRMLRVHVIKWYSCRHAGTRATGYLIISYYDWISCE